MFTCYHIGGDTMGSNLNANSEGRAESMESQIINRLDNMERKLDEMGKALIQMARTEERVSIIIEQNSVLFKQMGDATKERSALKDRIHKLETENATQGQSIGFFERAGWAVAAVIGSILSAIAGWMLK